MSATTQPTDFSDLYTALLNATRQDTGSSATVSQAKRYINTALYDLHLGFGEKLPWAERRAVLTTHPTYSDGTCDPTNGSQTVTGNSTLWNTNNAYSQSNVVAGGKIIIGGAEEVYEVSSTPTDTSLVITSPYLGDTDTEVSYRTYQDEYDLASDFLKPIDQTRLSEGPVPIALIGRNEFRRRFPDNKIVGRPYVGTIFDFQPSGDTTPIRRLVLAPPPDAAYQITYRYVTKWLGVSSTGTNLESLSSDTDEPLLPIRYRHAVVFHALYHWYRDKKDDTRSQEARAEYVDIVNRIVADNDVGDDRARIAPRVGPYRARARRPYTRGSARYDLNGRFDRFEDGY